MGETVAKRKRCPKCGGSVLLNKDFYGWYEECLQCGHMHDLKVIATARRSRGSREEGEETRGMSLGG